MENFEELFKKEMVENISNLVEEKMKVLKEINDFNEKDKKLSLTTEEFQMMLPDNLKNKFKEVMRLNYQVEEYYFTLAYQLGIKYGLHTSKR